MLCTSSLVIPNADKCDHFAYLTSHDIRVYCKRHNVCEPYASFSPAEQSHGTIQRLYTETVYLSTPDHSDLLLIPNADEGDHFALFQLLLSTTQEAISAQATTAGTVEGFTNKLQDLLPGPQPEEIVCTATSCVVCNTVKLLVRLECTSAAATDRQSECEFAFDIGRLIGKSVDAYLQSLRKVCH